MQCYAEYRALDHFTAVQLEISGADLQTRRAAWLFGLKRLLSFRKGYFYFKTPAWLLRYLYHYLTGLLPLSHDGNLRPDLRIWDRLYRKGHCARQFFAKFKRDIFLLMQNREKKK